MNVPSLWAIHVNLYFNMQGISPDENTHHVPAHNTLVTILLP